MVCFYISELGADGGALDQRKEISLDALCRHSLPHVGEGAIRDCQLIDLIEEDDAVLFNAGDGLALDVNRGVCAF